MLEYAYSSVLLIILVLLLAYLQFSFEKRERAEDAEWLARQKENDTSWRTQEGHSPGRAFDVSSIAPQIKRLRQDYEAARHSRPHYVFYRRGLLAVAREAVTRLSFFDHGRKNAKSVERDSVEF
jgi:cbb3-type cytochrome oxidase subunit 3